MFNFLVSSWRQDMRFYRYSWNRLRSRLGKGKRRSKKELLKKSIQFNFGEQDQVDLVSYSGLEENTSYLQIGDTFVRTLFISGYPFVATTGWLNMLINFKNSILKSPTVRSRDGVFPAKAGQTL